MGETVGEKHQCVVASRGTPPGTQSATQACALTGNQTGDPLVRRPAFSPLSHTSQGNNWYLKDNKKEFAVVALLH